MSDTLNNVTNQLLLKYDKNFQKYYQASDVLNQGIMNKEELILKNLQENERKDKIIRILNVTIVFVILAAILFSAHALQKIQNKQFYYHFCHSFPHCYIRYPAKQTLRCI